MIDVFGQLGSGGVCRAVFLRCGALSARVLTLGAILQDLRLSGRPLTIGSGDVADYDEGPMRYFGAVIGPVAGRVAGAAGEIGGKPIRMEANDGPNALHGGSAGLHRKLWQIEEVRDTAVSLVATARAGEGGLPGNRRFRARYEVEEAALRLTLEAETDAPTWVTLTQHSYWHLGGAPGIDGHSLSVAADSYLPIGPDTLPLGHEAPVSDTRFDFRTLRALGAEDRLDHCFCVSRAPRPLSPAATLRSPDGWRLDLATEAPGLQIHTGDGVRIPPGLAFDGVAQAGRPGLALEPQDWPDAPHNPSFPQIDLAPGARWRRTTRFALHTG